MTHADLPSVTCNYGSWLKRGWCRLEMISLMLSRFNDMPVIVVTGPECQPFMISPTTIMARPAGAGEFTWCVRKLEDAWWFMVGWLAGVAIWIVRVRLRLTSLFLNTPHTHTHAHTHSCARNHEMPNADGTVRKIPCDRGKIGLVVWTLLMSKLEFVGRADEGSVEDYRMWTSLVPHFMRDLPVPDEYSMYVPSTVEEFLRLYR